MTREVVLLLAVASVSTGAWAQEPGYPITVVLPGKGPYHFPQGYQTPWDKIEMLVTEKLAPNLYSLHGSAGLDPSHPDAAGGRVVVLFGSDGVLMVDTEDPQLATKTLDTIRTFTSAPIKIVVNSHIHPDHTGGNGFFAKQGAVIFSQENLRDEMLSPPGQGNANRALDPAGIPTSTYRYVSPGAPAVTIHMNGETVDFIPMMPSHTAGDTIVRFNQANVIYIEDFYRNFGYPFADQANGGSIKGMIEAVDLIEKLGGPETTLVPGHGTLVRKKDLVGYRAMLVDILGKVQKLRDTGKSLDEVLAADLTAPYDATTLGDTKQSKDRFITEVYDEVKDFPAVVNGERKMPSATRPGR
jgi:cyclase